MKDLKRWTTQLHRIEWGPVVRPYTRKYTLYLWGSLRPRHPGWRRHVETWRDTLRTVYYWGPLELVVDRPFTGRLGYPTLCGLPGQHFDVTIGVWR